MSDKRKTIDAERQNEIIQTLSELAAELGWHISYEVTPSEKVPGLIMGTPEYTSRTLEAIEGATGIEYETMAFQTDDEILH